MKEQILQIAIKQMRSGGYDNLNFANIASELSTSRANLHHHFKNKEGLGIAALQHYILHEKAFKDAIVRNNEGDIKAILAELELQLIPILMDTSFQSSCILSQVIHDGEAPDAIRKLAAERYLEEQHQFEKQIVKSKSQGLIDNTVDEKALAFKIMTTLFGMIQVALIRTDNVEFEQNIEGLLVSCLP